MAEIETQEEVSTPVETVEEETSLDVEPAEAETSTEESESIEVPAETETETKEAEPPAEEQKLFAGKYKSVEELEKGYKELNGSFTKSKEFESKYNELLKQQQEQADKLRAYQQNLKLKKLLKMRVLGFFFLIVIQKRLILFL